MRRTSPIGPASIVVLIAATASCTMRTPTAPENGGGVPAAPVIVQPQCGAVSTWPEGPVALAWRAVSAAATYTVEIDCMNCGNRPDPWVSQSGTPWHIRSGLSTPMYSADIIATLRREGGRAMRWRVWGVDTRGREGPKTDWCVTAFSDSGLPTPGAGTP